LSSDSNLVCETGARATASLINTSQPGAYGLKHNFANPEDPKKYPTWNSIVDGTIPVKSSLATTLETPKNIYDSLSGHIYDGWFYAPESGNYKFYLSGDDQVKLFLNTNTPYD